MIEKIKWGLMKKTSKNRIYPKENVEELKDTIQKLKARNKKIEKQNTKLKSELKTLEAAFKETNKFLKGQMADFSLDDIFKAIKEKKSLKKEFKVVTEKKDKCPACNKGTLKKSQIKDVGLLEVCSECSHTNMDKNESKN
jgi:DNA repair exonuclease SbcCD ATPase subunit